METPDYTLAEITPEEMASLSAEMTTLLEKYNCEMVVRSNIEILKRVPITQDGTNTEETIQENPEESTDIHETIGSSEA